ncbi:IclR family transcriptional regulator [Actinomadura rugatobispora]|uniref:IclR family transcriptional regulator n=1 Tax=Actinomadura rugatobispora TaxID=1994 RepID=A0ABW0ZWM2_9ACTN|nr:IclR family transcriptional regulator [Actinomadura rugatobispora]
MESSQGTPGAYGPAPRYPIESVDNALRLLSLFRDRERIRVKDAAEVLGVATGTAHRLLAMLVYRGYVSQDPMSKLYVPGAMLLSIGLQAARRSDLREAAQPFLDELNERLGETIHLATLEGTEVLYVDGRESHWALRVISRAGTLQPAHCTSVGKALLAELSRERLLELYPQERLPQPTPRSIGMRSQLLIDLESVRSRGYALNFGELEEGVGSLATTVHGPQGLCVAALSVGAPLSRLDDLRMQQMAEELKQTAARFQESLSG